MKKDRAYCLSQDESIGESLEVAHSLVIPRNITLTVEGNVDAETLFCEGTLKATGTITIRQDVFCSGRLEASSLQCRGAIVGESISAILNTERSVALTQGADALFAFDERHLALPKKFRSSDDKGGDDVATIEAALIKMKPLFRKSCQTPTERVVDAIEKKKAKKKPVTSMSFADKELPRIPKVLFEQHELKTLNLNSNRLESLPDEIGNLQALKKLSLQYNHLRALPSSIGNCRALEDLHIGCNLLRALPNTMAALQSLKKLDMSYTNSVTTSRFKVAPPETIPK